MVEKQGIKEFRVLEPNNLVENLIAFIEEQLPNFTRSNEFVDIVVKKKNEDQHSTAFCVFMTNRCNSVFCFQRENAQKGSRTIDIGVYSGSTLIYTIEAKLLPTPKGPKRNEHEYVHGKGAGIQRFKDEAHGLDNEDNLLNESGLIAYLKKNNFEYWFIKINQWIADAKWGEDEKLEIVGINSIATLKSMHLRRNKSKISLYHFWVYVN